MLADKRYVYVKWNTIEQRDEKEIRSFRYVNIPDLIIHVFSPIINVLNTFEKCLTYLSITLDIYKIYTRIH